MSRVESLKIQDRRQTVTDRLDSLRFVFCVCDACVLLTCCCSYRHSVSSGYLCQTLLVCLIPLWPVTMPSSKKKQQVPVPEVDPSEVSPDSLSPSSGGSESEPDGNGQISNPPTPKSPKTPDKGQKTKDKAAKAKTAANKGPETPVTPARSHCSQAKSPAAAKTPKSAKSGKSGRSFRRLRGTSRSPKTAEAVVKSTFAGLIYAWFYFLSGFILFLFSEI